MKKIFTLAISLAAVFGFNASADCYLIGAGVAANEGVWDPAVGVQLPAAGDNVYAGDVELIDSYFGVVSQLGEPGGWDDLNGNYRYVPGELGGDIAAEGTTTLTMLPPGNGDNSFHCLAAGTYNITVNFNDLTLTATPVGEVTPPEPIDPPTGDNPILATGECYIFGGGVVGSDWGDGYGTGLALTDNGDGHFVGTFDFTDAGYFSLSAKNDCSGWDELNSTYRCAPAADGTAVEIGTPYEMVVAGNAWVMETGGTYNVDVDANAFTVTFTEGSGVQTIARDAKKSGIYNLQGMKVNEMIPGQLYIVDGKKVIATR